MDQVINSKAIKELFSKSADVLVRPIKINQNGITFSIFCVDGLINSELVDEGIFQTMHTDPYIKECRTEREVMNYLMGGGAYHVFTTEVSDYQELLKYVLSGMVAFLFDGEKKAIVYDIRMFDKRSISEPTEETVIKGAKDSFLEVMRSNTALIRRRVRSEYLVVEKLSVGTMSKTDLSLVYISNLVNMDSVNKIRDIINSIEIDNISTPVFIEEFLVENKKSVFPQIMFSQRPDRIAANLTDGRIALVVDGIPFVYLLPCQMVMLMQSPEDYANHYFIGSSLRMLRYFSMVLTMLLPAFYIAAATYQNQMLPVQLALSTQAAKQNVPFSSSSEVLGLLLCFEILIEAGLRLPRVIGTAVSILGGIVVGQSAVSANIVSPLVVVIVSLAGIAGFIVPNQDLSSAIRVVRFLFAIMAAVGGFFGLTISIIVLLTHLCSMDNYGIAYLSPFVDIDESNHKDTFVRFPVKYFTKRSQRIVPNNRWKQNNGEKHS